MRRQIFRQVKQTEEARVNPLLTRFVTHDVKDASKSAAKALAVNPALLPTFPQLEFLKPESLSRLKAGL